LFFLEREKENNKYDCLSVIRWLNKIKSAFPSEYDETFRQLKSKNHKLEKKQDNNSLLDFFQNYNAEMSVSNGVLKRVGIIPSNEDKTIEKKT
jgi:hypothetical protein